MTYLEKSADEKCEMEEKLLISRKETSMTPRTQHFYWTRYKDIDKGECIRPGDKLLSETEEVTECFV